MPQSEGSWKKIARTEELTDYMYIHSENEYPTRVFSEDDTWEWNFTRTTTMHPYWAIPRMTEAEVEQIRANENLKRQKQESLGRSMTPRLMPQTLILNLG